MITRLMTGELKQVRRKRMEAMKQTENNNTSNNNNNPPPPKKKEKKKEEEINRYINK